jgi:hypothetical protein
VADPENPAMNADQPAGLDPMFDLGRAHAGVDEFPPGDDPMGLEGQLRE